MKISILTVKALQVTKFRNLVDINTFFPTRYIKYLMDFIDELYIFYVVNYCPINNAHQERQEHKQKIPSLILLFCLQIVEK